MLVARLTEPVDVRLIEDRDWFEPWLVPLAIVLAGLIATLLSWWIHRQSLDAEDRRLRRRLVHDRRMRDRDARRQMFDGVFSMMSQRIDAVTDFDTASRELLEERQHIAWLRRQDDVTLDQRTEAEAHANTLRVRMLAAHEAAHRADTQALAARARLQLWFPQDHPIVESFTEWHETLHILLAQIDEANDEEIPPEEVPMWDHWNKASGETLGAFLETCRRTLELADEGSAAA